jgi:hypothetical protein
MESFPVCKERNLAFRVHTQSFKCFTDFFWWCF